MRRNLIRYLPDILKRNLDFRILMEVQETAVQRVWNAVQEVFDDQFISTADEYGIARLETILGLQPGAGDDLESRRNAVRMAWYHKRPIGIQDLQEVADIWKKDLVKLEYVEPLTLVIWLTENAPYGPFEAIAPLHRELRDLAPANVAFDYAYRYLLVKEVHQAMTVGELGQKLLQNFAGGTRRTDRTRGNGLLQFGDLVVVRKCSKINVRDDGTTLHITYREED